MSQFAPPSLPIVRTLRVRYLLIVDFFLVLLSVALAILLRLEQWDTAWRYMLNGGWILFLLSPLVRLPLYYRFGLYNRLWRYASTAELTGILQAGFLAPVLIGVLNFGVLAPLGLLHSPSRSVWLLEALCSLTMLAGVRLTFRLLHQQRDVALGEAIPTLIVGAGDAGAMILREIQRNPGLGLQVVGFVDDAPEKHYNILLGVPVLGDRQQLPALLSRYNIRQVIIAMPTAPGKVIRDVVNRCEEAGIRPRIVPNLRAMVNGDLAINQLRAVEIEDLLRREPIVTDTDAVKALLRDKRVLVTGGGGSIGRELCRQILQCAPAELIILGHGENSVFEIEQEVRRFLLRERIATKVVACIADVRLPDRILEVFFTHRPQIVFHAAAHKHVPLMEANPGEAVTNNLLGTRNVLNAAQAVAVERFVMVSTDKAVNPTNVMGATKRGAEMLLLDAARRAAKPYVAVRFGNVLGSRGSVILTFKEQIAQGGPVTVTHPEVTRYFMTIPEAVQLVLQAAVLGQGGEIFMLDMGDPVRIVDLAHDLIRLSGLEVERDIDIVFTGMRPGEKLYEELFLPGEVYHTTAHPKIRIAVDAARLLPTDLHARVAALEETVLRRDEGELRRALHALVPEYRLPAVPMPAAPDTPTPAQETCRPVLDPGD